MENTWAIPGGFLEIGESPRAAARRELLEETGLRVRLTGVLDSYRAGGPSGGVLFICYRGEAAGGELIAGDDALDAGFFPLDRPPAPLARNPHPLILERLRASTRGNR
jgi:8-oxo-dGTP diphosphatase